MKLSITRHAEKRRTEMQLTTTEVADTIRDAEISYEQGNTHRNRGTVFQRGELSVVAELLDSSTNHYQVITILPRTTETYERPKQ